MILILFLFLEIMFDLRPLLYPPIYYWLSIIGFWIMGLTFYMAFIRYDIQPIRFLKKDANKLYFFSLLFIVIITVFFEVIYMFLLLSWYYNVMNWDAYFRTMDIMEVASPLFRLLIYIAIVFIGLFFNKIVHGMFGSEAQRMKPWFNPRFMTNIALVVGALACIFQTAALVIEVFWMPNGVDETTFPRYNLGTDFVVITSIIPFCLGRLLIAVFLVIILFVTMNSVPIQLQHLVIGKSFRMDIQPLFRFSLILIVLSSVLRMFTGIIFTWRSFFEFRMRDEFFFDAPFHEEFIVNMYHLARFLSPLLVYLGFALVCLCFHHIFRAREYAKLAEPGKPT
jgi:hypothetical protein